MKNQNGVTLIALVITIIVLLILAGVSIAMLTGDNGLLTRARQASDETIIANGKELAETDLQGYITDWYDAKYVSSTPTEQTLFDYVKDEFASSDESVYTVDNATGVVTIKDTDVTGTLTSGNEDKSISINWVENP